MAYEFGRRLQSRLDRMGGGLGDALQMALGAYNLPDTVGKDGIFGMSDLRGLLRFGGDMGIDPLTMELLGRALPNFNNEAWRPNKQNMPGVYQGWMASRDPNYVRPDGAGQPDPTQPPPGQSPPPGVNPGYRGVDAPQPGRDPRGRRRNQQGGVGGQTMGGGGYQGAPADGYEAYSGGIAPPPAGPTLGPPLLGPGAPAPVGFPTYGPPPTMGGGGRTIGPTPGTMTPGALGGKTGGGRRVSAGPGSGGGGLLGGYQPPIAGRIGSWRP